MAIEKNLVTTTEDAAANLSSYQYRCVVQQTTDGRVALSGNAAVVFGVLQNKPAAAGRGAIVAIGGITKMRAEASVAGTALAPGTALMSSTIGLAVKATTGGTAYVFGRSMDILSTSTVAPTTIISARITNEGPTSTA